MLIATGIWIVLSVPFGLIVAAAMGVGSGARKYE